MIAQPFERIIRPFYLDGFFDPEGAVWFYGFAVFQGHCGRQAAMGINEDVEIIAPFDSHFFDLFNGPCQVPGHGNGEIVADFCNRWACFDGIASDLSGALHSGFSASSGVDPNFVSCGTSKEFVDGQARYFSENIPECDVDCTERCAEENSDVPAVPAVQSLPEKLDVRWIFPDEMTFHVFDALGDGSYFVVAD